MSEKPHIYNKELLKREMIRQGLTPKQIAERAGLDNKTVDKIINKEGGRASSFYKVAKVLGFPVTQIGRGYKSRTFDLSAIMSDKTDSLQDCTG